MQYHKQVTSFSSRTCHVMSCHFMSCHSMSCYVIPCHVIPCHVIAERIWWYATCTYVSTSYMYVKASHSFHFMSCQMSCYVKMALQSQYLKMNEPLSSNSFLSVLNRDITLFMNLWKYLFSCLWGADGCSKEAGELDSDILCDGLFLGGPAGEAEISASASRTRRTTCNKKKHMICSGYWPGVNFIIK